MDVHIIVGVARINRTEIEQGIAHFRFTLVVILLAVPGERIGRAEGEDGIVEMIRRFDIQMERIDRVAATRDGT